MATVQVPTGQLGSAGFAIWVSPNCHLISQSVGRTVSWTFDRAVGQTIERSIDGWVGRSVGR